MIRLAIAGALGRMGRSIIDLASARSDAQIVCGLVAPEDPQAGQEIHCGDRRLPLRDRLDHECDALIDVSVPAGTAAWVAYCERRDLPMVIGVTGHSEGQLKRIHEAAHQIPIVLAANFSVGLNSILDLIVPLVQRIGPDYDVEIVETHHRDKKDAPSGTALEIVGQLRRAADQIGQEGMEPVFGRHGQPGPRPGNEIGIHSLRMGDVAGRHEVHFCGQGETITIAHAAHSRHAFAAGALRAANWIVQQGAGLYSMRDVLAVDGVAEPGIKEPDVEI